MFEKIEIKRSNSTRRLRIEVIDGGVIKITAPRFVSDAKCLEFMNLNAAKLQKMIQKQLEFEDKKDALGGYFLHLGSKTPLQIDEYAKKKYTFGDTGLVLSKKEHFRDFLRDEAKRIITPKACMGWWGLRECPQP